MLHTSVSAKEFLANEEQLPCTQKKGKTRYTGLCRKAGTEWIIFDCFRNEECKIDNPEFLKTNQCKGPKTHPTFSGTSSDLMPCYFFE